MAFYSPIPYHSHAVSSIKRVQRKQAEWQKNTLFASEIKSVSALLISAYCKKQVVCRVLARDNQ